MALLDATKTSRHTEFFGTIIQFLRQQDTFNLLHEWSDELPCAAALSRFSEACQVSPFIADEYPSMPAIRQVFRQLIGGLLTKLSAVALVAPDVPVVDGVDKQWITAFRLWVFIQTVNSVYQGGRPNNYLLDVTQKLRLAIDKDEEAWLGLFSRLKCGTASVSGMTRDLAATSERLLANRKDPVKSSVHRTLLSTLRNFCEGKTPDSQGEDDAEGHGLFLKFLAQNQYSLSTLTGTVEIKWPVLGDAETEQDTGKPCVLRNFDPHGAEESAIGITDVDEAKTPPEQIHQAQGILLATAEDHQFLPFSWNRPSPAELLCLEQWMSSALREDDQAQQALASFVEIAIRSANSLDTVLPIAISKTSAADWSVDLAHGCLHRKSPRRYNGWRATPETVTWVEPLAERSQVDLTSEAVAILQRLRNASPTSTQLGHLWAGSFTETPATLFNRTCRETKGMERLRSGMLAQILEQRVFGETNDPVLSQLLASHPRSGLGGACAYSSYRHDQVRQLLTSAVPFSTDPPNDSADPQENGAGSELSPLDDALRQACEEALAKVNALANQPEKWIAHHNALTSYLVVVLLAATAARPVSSPFESLAYFDWDNYALYVEDKISSQLHQGRLVPLPESVVLLLRGSYLPHLARLAVTVAEIDTPLSEVLQTLSRGVPSDRLPLFFLLSKEDEKGQRLRWSEVTETSLSALEVFSWPLPWNLMRHRLPTTLKRMGQDHESINGMTGHGENGTEAYGPYSMRIWQADADALRQPLTEALQRLQLQTPAAAQWPATPIPRDTTQASASCVGESSRFGSVARAHRRAANHEKATTQATADIVEFVGQRPINSLSPEDWEVLSQKMLLNPDGRPRTLGTLRYDSLQKWISRNWDDKGLRPRIKRRYLPSLEEKSPFTADAIGCMARVNAALENARLITAAAVSQRPSKREALALGILLVILESRVGNPAVIEDLLIGKNFQLVLFESRFHLEHSPGLDKVTDAPVRRHEISSTAAVLLAVGKSSTYQLDVRQWAFEDQLGIICQCMGLDGRQRKSFQACVRAVAVHVRQANSLQFPGLVASYLNGDVVTAGLDHADWIRVKLGKAAHPASLKRPKIETRIQTDEENDDDSAPPDDLDEGYLAGSNAFLSVDTKKDRSPSQISLLQENSAKFFQSIREALNTELENETLSRRDLDTRLKTIIRQNKDVVSRSCLLLGEWQRSLLWRKTSKGLIRIRSLKRYLNALSVCFQAMAYAHDLLDCDEDEVTEFYRQVLEIRQLIRPEPLSAQTTKSARSADSENMVDTETDAAAIYRSQSLAFQLLKDFHRLMSRQFGVEDPDWSELSVGDELLSISPGMMTESEYLCALKSLAPHPANASREALARAFILLTTYRFGLRGDEATGMLRSDWVDDQPDAIVLLVRPNTFRKLKTTAGQRQVPLLFVLTELEKDVIVSWLRSWESITTLDGIGPLFADKQSPDQLMKVKQLRRDVGKIIKQVTGNSNLSTHHARHSFGNRVALLLMQGVGGIWPHAANINQQTAERQTHVRRLLLGTEKVTRRTLWAIARLLGHAHPVTAVRSYLHLLPELAALYVNLPVTKQRPISKVLFENCIDLDSVTFIEGYLQPIFDEFEEPISEPLTADRALGFLHLCQRGIDQEHAREVIGIPTEDAYRLINGVKTIDSILARRLAINPPKGGPYNLLGHIPQARWVEWIERSHGVILQERPPEDPGITFNELPFLIGSSRQVVLWKPQHFHFFRRVTDYWKLTEDSYRIHRTKSGAVELQAMATQAQLRLEAMHGNRADSNALQIDTMALVDPPVLVRYRCAVVAQTHPESAFRSSHELLLITLVSLALFGHPLLHTPDSRNTPSGK